MQGERVMSNPKFVEITKFRKRRRKHFDLTGFSLLELIRVFPLAPDGFLVSPYVQRHLKKERVSMLAHWEFTKYPLETPFSN